MKRGYGARAVARDPPAAGRPTPPSACSLLAGLVAAPGLGREPLPGVQGARLPDALDHRARHFASRGAADRDPGQPRAADDPRRAQLRLAHRPGVPGRGDRRLELRRELGQRRSQRRLRQDARRRSRRRWTPTPASTTTCRPTSASASTRCWRVPRSRSWCASSAPDLTTLREPGRPRAQERCRTSRGSTTCTSSSRPTCRRSR